MHSVMTFGHEASAVTISHEGVCSHHTHDHRPYTGFMLTHVCMELILHAGCDMQSLLPCWKAQQATCAKRTSATASCTWLFSYMIAVCGPLQVCRPVKCDGMLFEDDGGVGVCLDTVENDRLATFKPKSHVLLPATSTLSVVLCVCAASRPRTADAQLIRRQR